MGEKTAKKSLIQRFRDRRPDAYGAITAATEDLIG